MYSILDACMECAYPVFHDILPGLLNDFEGIQKLGMRIANTDPPASYQEA
jgi:hypothetical protein